MEIILPKEDEGPEISTPSKPLPPKPGGVIELPDEGDTLRDNYWKTIEQNPDQAAQIVRLSKTFRQPPATVAMNLPQMKAAAEAPPDEYWKNLEATSPMTAKYLRDKDRMAFAKDDIPNLSKFEKVVSGWRKGSLEGQLADLSLERLKAARSGVQDWEQLPHDADLKRLRDEVAPYQKLDVALGRGQYLFQTAAQAPNMTRAFLKPEKLFDDFNPMDAFGPATARGAQGVVAGAAGGAMAGAAAGALAGGVGAVPGALGGLTTGAGVGGRYGVIAGLAEHAYRLEAGLAFDEYSDIRDRNGQRISPKAAADAAHTVGLINAGLETAGDLVMLKVLAPVGKAAGGAIAAPALKVISKIPGSQKLVGLISKRPEIFAGMTIGKAIREAGKLAALGVVGEATTEYAQEVSTGFGRQASIDKSGQEFEPGVRPTTGDVFSQARGVIAPTVESMVLPVALGGGFHIYNRSVEMKRAQAQSDVYRSLKEPLTASKLRARSPEEANLFTQIQVNGTPIESVGVPSETFNTHFQEANINPEDAAKELGISPEAYRETLKRGGDLQVPFAVWTDKLVQSDHYMALADDIRFQADLPTVNEIKGRKDLARTMILEEVDAIQKENPVFREEREAVYNDIYQKALAAGRPDKEAQAAAEIWAAYAVVRAKKANTTPLQWYQKGPAVQTASGAVQQGKVAQATHEQAENAKERFYHGTNAAKAILANGFQIDQQAQEGSSFLGDNLVQGVHLTRNLSDFSEEGQLGDVEDILEIPHEFAKVLKTDLDGFAKLQAEAGIDKFDENAPAKMADYLKAKGYDAIDFGTEVVALYPERLNAKPVDSRATASEKSSSSEPAPGEGLYKPDIPVVQPTKTGEPYGLFSYNSDLNDEGEMRSMYTIYGDPQHPLIKEGVDAEGKPLPGAGFTTQRLSWFQERGIPIKGMEPRAAEKGWVPLDYPTEGPTHEQAGNSTARAFIKFTPAQAVITLLNADRSSFMHESAHFFLQDLFEFNRSPLAGEEAKRDWKVLSDWVSEKPDKLIAGIKGKLRNFESREKSQENLAMVEYLKGALASIEERGGATYVREVAQRMDFSAKDAAEREIAGQVHEIFARGFEAYLMEGKAPSVGLTKVFGQFRQWLLRIYRSVQGLDVEINPEVRGVMDRMLASEEEIELARSHAGEDFSTIPPGTDPEVVKRLQAMRDRAHEEAVRILLTEQMKEMSDEAVQRLKQEEISARIDATKAIKESEIQTAIEALKQTFKKDALKTAQAYWVNKGLTERERIQFENLAEARGFASADELAKKIIDERPVEEQVQDAVDTHMAQFVNLKDTDRIKEEALKAIHNEMQTEVLALENAIFEGLASEAEGRTISQARARSLAKLEAQEAKAEAKRHLATLPISDAGNFVPFLTAERNHAVKAAKAIQRKDYVAAAKAKRQQMLNHALAAEAIKVKTEIDKSLTVLRKLGKRGRDLLKMPYGFVRHIDQLLVRHGLADPPPEDVATFVKTASKLETEGATVDAISNATGMTKDAQSGQWRPESLPELAQRAQESYYTMVIPQSVLAGSAKPYRQLKLGELRDLKSAVKSVYSIGRTFEHFLSSWVRVDMRAAGKEAAESIRANVGDPYAIQRTIGHEANKYAEMLNQITAQPGDHFIDLVNLLNLCRYLDGGKNDGPMTQYVYRVLKHADDSKLTRNAASVQATNAILSKHFTAKEFAGIQEEKKYFDFLDQRRPYLTREEMIAVALNWGNEGNRDRIRAGFKLEDAQIMEIVNSLTKNEMNFVQDVWDYLDSFWPEIVDLEMKAAGVQPKKVANAVVETVHGIYKGGYYPIAYDYAKSSDAHRNAEKNNALYKQYSAAAAHTDHGHTEQRVQHNDRPIRLSIDVFINHVENVVHDLSYRPAVIDVNRFLMQKDLREAIQNAIGGKGLRAIEDAVKTAASDQGEFLTWMEQKLRWLRLNLTMAQLGWKIASVPIDLITNSGMAVAELGPRGYANAVNNFLDNREENIDYVDSLSPRMKERASLRDRDLRALAKRWAGKDNFYSRSAFFTLSMSDQAISYPLWLAVFNQNIATLGQQKAVDIADETITRAFGSGSALDQAAIQRGGEWQKLFTIMYGWAGTMFNRAWSAGKLAGLAYDAKNYLQATAIVGTAVFYIWILPSLVDSFWKELFRNVTGSPDKERRKQRILGRLLRQPFGYFPFGFVSSKFIDRAMGKPMMSKGSDIAALGAAEDIIGPFADLIAAAGGHKLPKDFAESLAGAVFTARGWPKNTLYIAFNFIDWLNGEGELTWRDLVARRTKH